MNKMAAMFGGEDGIAEAMRALAEKEGRTGTHWNEKPGPVDARCVTKFASEETVVAVRLIMERPRTSEQISEILGIKPHSVSNRFASLRRSEVVKVIGTVRSGKWQQERNIWGPGPGVDEWLERMERNA